MDNAKDAPAILAADHLLLQPARHDNFAEESWGNLYLHQWQRVHHVGLPPGRICISLYVCHAGIVAAAIYCLWHGTMRFESYCQSVIKHATHASVCAGALSRCSILGCTNFQVQAGACVASFVFQTAHGARTSG